MKTKALVIVALALMVTLLLASVAQAGGGTAGIIKDAADGTLDGNYTAAQINAALALIRNNPTYLQYSDVEGVLEDYLASLPSPGVGAQGGLKFTGGALELLFGAGFGLMAIGLTLRKQRA